MNPSYFNRREALRRLSCGFGWLALSGLTGLAARAANPLAPQIPHLPARQGVNLNTRRECLQQTCLDCLSQVGVYVDR